MSGRLAHGIFDDNKNYQEIISLRDTVWKLLKSLTSNKFVAVTQWNLRVINPRVPGYVVGRDAAAWCAASEENLLKDRGTENYYLPTELAIERRLI